MARKRRRSQQNQGQKNSVANQTKRQGFGSDLKPNRCSTCRYNRKDEPCYKKKKLLSGLEYVDCVPGLIHYPYKKLEALGLI